MRWRLAVLTAVALVAAGQAAAQSPRRIVSLNPCLDAIVAAVADREQIAALSHYARDPAASSIPAFAAGVPITYETAEEVMGLGPDLVLTGRHSAPATRAALRRLGIKTEAFSVPSTVEESLAQVTRIAGLVGHPERGRALNARIRAAIAASAPPPGTPRFTALIYETRGFASAEGTLADDMMRRAGFVNAAARYGLKKTGDVALERVVADPPQVLLAGVPRPGAPSWADRVLSHPALKTVTGRMYKAYFPERLMYCGGPVLIETAQMLTRARNEALARAP